MRETKEFEEFFEREVRKVFNTDLLTLTFEEPLCWILRVRRIDWDNLIQISRLFHDSKKEIIEYSRFEILPDPDQSEGESLILKINNFS
tara:strand:- start:575 stop:841 length:267 start_codon:yes stop_codon:yes gene_type:complete